VKDWQKVFLRAAGVAAGVTVALSGVAFSIYWYSSRPKSWDTKAISCVSANAGAVYEYNTETRVMKASGFSLRFALANNTGRDYTVPPNIKLFKRQTGTQALEEFNGKLEHAFLIPAHERAQLTIQADYGCGVSDLDGGHVSERDEPTCFHDAFGEVSGFVALDEDNKVRLNLLKPTLVTSKDEKVGVGSKTGTLSKPDKGDVFDRVAACQQADEFVAVCKKQNVRPTPGSFAAYGGYADHLPEWAKPPSGYKLDATPQSCEVAMEWQNYCRRAK
jgi:hypothetical protein